MGSEQIEALKEEIWRRAREKAEKILSDARAEAEKIIEGAKQKAEEALRRRVDPEKLIVRRRVLGRAISEGRKLVILARNEVIEKAFQRALDKLKVEAESKSEEYRSFLLKLLKNAFENLGSDGGEITIYANESDIDLLKSMVKELTGSQVSIRFEKADIMGGLIASEADGRKVFYGSIESRLEALKPALRDKVASMLFKEVRRT